MKSVNTPSQAKPRARATQFSLRDMPPVSEPACHPRVTPRADHRRPRLVPAGTRWPAPHHAGDKTLVRSAKPRRARRWMRCQIRTAKEPEMLSELTEAMIVNGVVLATVLGPARKIGPARLVRPVIAAAVIIPLFVDRPVTHGTGLVVELAGIVAGVLGGL